MRYLSFDLSSRVIGCVFATTDSANKVERIASAPIVPPTFHPDHYLRSKKELLCGKETVNAWALPGETKITKAEKKRRDAEVRACKDRFLLAYISGELHKMIISGAPDEILVEKNEIFNGVLTSVLLGKIMGVLHGVAGTEHIPVTEHRVGAVRQPYNIFQLVLAFADGKSAEELSGIPDVTKRAIRLMLEEKYHIQFVSDDESDACLVLDYHLNHWNKGGGKK